MKPIPKGVLSKITEYANLNEPKNPYGGKRQNKKKTHRKRNTKKNQKSKSIKCKKLRKSRKR
jgi:hypothetical protein